MKKKILIRIGSLRHGGAEKVLTNFLKNLPEDQYEIDLLLNLYSGKYLSEIPRWVNVLYLIKGEMITTNRPKDIPIKIGRVLFERFLKKFPKILYRWKLKNNVYDVELAAIQGMRDEILNSPIKSSKKIIWIHSDLSQVKGYNDEEIKRFFAFDRIMVISEKIEQLFYGLAENDTQKQKIVRIYNPLDTQEILEKSKHEVMHYTFDPNIPTFLSVGTVFPLKGFDRLLKVHRRILDEGLMHRILIIGDGYDFNNIQKLKSKFNLDQTTTMLGFIDNPYPYFREAHFYILSSTCEGFPTVLSEAITLKKKIIATQVSGVNDILCGGSLGLIVENSEEGIYAGMKKALVEPEFFDLFETQLKDYQMPFTLKSSVKKICDIIEE